MITAGTVKVLCISPDKGQPKPQVDSGYLRADFGFEGDIHAGRELRQVSIFNYETIQECQAKGIALAPGMLGENIITEGEALQHLNVGDELRIGPTAVLEIVELKNPCKSFSDIDIRLPKAVFGRVWGMCRVITSGPVHQGDEIQLERIPATTELAS